MIIVALSDDFISVEESNNFDVVAWTVDGDSILVFSTSSEEVAFKIRDRIAQAFDSWIADNHIANNSDSSEITNTAFKILNSESFMWLMAGANHPDAHISVLKPIYKKFRELGGGFNNG